MPLFDSGDFVKHAKIEKRTVFRILKYLSDEKILSDDKKVKNKTYFFNDLIKIIM